MFEAHQPAAPTSHHLDKLRPAHNAPIDTHPFDQSTLVRLLDASSLPEEILQLYESERSRGALTSLAVYGATILPSFGNTPKHSNGGHLGSIILNACITYQKARGSAGLDPLSITFDYLSPTAMGEAYVLVSSTPRGSGRSGLSDLHADLYQLGSSAASRSPDALGAAASASHRVRAHALFGAFSGKGPSATDPDYFGSRPALEDTPAPHPHSWYLPPKLTMISHHFNLLADLETGRRPRADYWIRFHPRGFPPQHLTAPRRDGPAQRALDLPPHCSQSRRLDLVSLPTLADLRRPAMENVLKSDPESEFDEPTRKWAYPTLSLTLRFLRPLVNGEGQERPEWVYVGWRETAHHGRVTSEIKMETEDGAVVCVGSMDSLMIPIEWYNKA